MSNLNEIAVVMRHALMKVSGDNRALASDVLKEQLERALSALQQRADSEDKRYDESMQLQAIGKSAMSSIADMVAALECDYDRLEELKEPQDWTTGSGYVSLSLKIDDAQSCAGSGQQDENVADLSRVGYIREQLDALESDDIVKTLADYGAWDAAELADRGQNEQRLLWLACCDIAEEHGAEFKELLEAAGECESRDDAEQRIQEDPLSVEVRGGWYTPGGDSTPEEFNILLGTGGPATRIMGELNEHGEPTRAYIQAQDWGTSWTDYVGGDQETLLTYCRCFYFGEG